MSKDKQKKKIYKPKPISGFPEWLPEYRVVEQQWMDKIRAVFESYGYCSIETPSVEELEVIAAKGEDVDKEIYVLERLQADSNDKKDARLALHFDQTVPFARYVGQHFNELTFPFKRYQMQRVWRGERPQLGRAREFYQCDIDVINVDSLPIHFDAEVAAICYEAMDAMDIGRVQLRISNRKILMGLLAHIEIEDSVGVTRIIDKIEKIGSEEVARILKDDLNIPSDQIQEVLTLVQTKDIPSIKALNDEMQEGIDELSFVLNNLKHLPDHAIVADLSIVRGLDYYTGTVYETRLLDIPEFTSSVCSGGRYDDLASNYINKKLPGVGISIGFTRLFEVLHHYNHIKAGKKSPADILMVLPSEKQRALASDTARTLRNRGFKVEMYHAPQKIGKQFSYAEKKNIQYVWIPPFEEGNAHEVKNLDSKTQTEADPNDWTIS
ncbi:MAG: histidine--tRNA ligase [Alphaproteobacteria bacterium]|nr:histidine--tRNA ligase [Alphaproteobacteria bacterium]